MRRKKTEIIKVDVKRNHRDRRRLVLKPAPRFNVRIAAVLAVLMIALSSAVVFVLIGGKGEVVLPPPLSRQILQAFGNPNDPAWTIDVIGDENFRILSDSTVRMLIDYNGNVGIGTASPSYALDVSGTLRGQNFITTGGHPVNDILLPQDIQNWGITSLKGSVGLDMTDNMEVKIAPSIFEDAEIMCTSATALINGNAFIAYSDCGNSNYGTFVIYDSAGNEVKSETIFSSANTGSTSATTLTNGNVLIAYNTDIAYPWYGTFVIYDSAGNQVKAPTEFENVGVFLYTSATTLTNGNVLIAYSATDTWHGTFVIYDSAGNQVKAPTEFESVGAGYISATTLTNGNVLIAYSDRGNSWHGTFVIYDSAGNQVKAPTEFQSAEVTYISATTLTNGNVLIAYSPTDTWYGNFVIYDSAGNQIKAPTVFVSGSVVPISATTLTNGNVLIAYNNRFVIYDSSGNQVQAPTAYESSNLDFISATTLTNGNVLIAYEEVPDYGMFVIYKGSGAYFSGNVGIGATAPQINLAIGDDNTGLYYPGGDNLAFYTDNTERMRIDNQGNVGIGMTGPAAVLHLKAGTASANTAPLKFTSGTNLTTPEAGANEYDGKVFYSTPIAGARGVSPSVQFVAIQADFTLLAQSGVQNCLTAANDTLTVAASTTYFFDAQYIINTGDTTHTTAVAFALGGGASVTSFEYTATLWSAAANTIATAQSTTHVSGVASKVINATSTAVYTIIQLQGVVRINAGGTIAPQIDFSANPTGTNLMKVGSYIRFYPVGTDTVAAVGPWN